jgi:hypothetical protein
MEKIRLIDNSSSPHTTRGPGIDCWMSGVKTSITIRGPCENEYV